MTFAYTWRRRGLAVALFGVLLLFPAIPVDSRQVLSSSRLNPRIEKIVAEISSVKIEANVRQLANFGTRHTLSSQDDPVRGIGAARRWIRAEFERYSQESGGRLIVSEDDFEQPAAPRIPKPVRLVNVVATLPGKQASVRCTRRMNYVSRPN